MVGVPIVRIVQVVVIVDVGESVMHAELTLDRRRPLGDEGVVYGVALPCACGKEPVCC